MHKSPCACFGYRGVGGEIKEDFALQGFCRCALTGPGDGETVLGIGGQEVQSPALRPARDMIGSRREMRVGLGPASELMPWQDILGTTS